MSTAGLAKPGRGGGRSSSPSRCSAPCASPPHAITRPAEAAAEAAAETAAMGGGSLLSSLCNTQIIIRSVRARWERTDATPNTGGGCRQKQAMHGGQHTTRRRTAISPERLRVIECASGGGSTAPGCCLDSFSVCGVSVVAIGDADATWTAFQMLSTDRLVVVTAVLSEQKSAPHRHLVVDSRRRLGVLLEPWHGRALMPDVIHQHGVAVLGEHRCRCAESHAAPARQSSSHHPPSSRPVTHERCECEASSAVTHTSTPRSSEHGVGPRSSAASPTRTPPAHKHAHRVSLGVLRAACVRVTWPVVSVDTRADDNSGPARTMTFFSTTYLLPDRADGQSCRQSGQVAQEIYEAGR
jgi:hypothetical protein